MMHRCCFEGVLFPGIAVIPRLGDRSPYGSWGSKNIQRSNNRPKRSNCHDDLVPAFSFPGVASPREWETIRHMGSVAQKRSNSEIIIRLCCVRAARSHFQEFFNLKDSCSIWRTLENGFASPFSGQRDGPRKSPNKTPWHSPIVLIRQSGGL